MPIDIIINVSRFAHLDTFLIFEYSSTRFRGICHRDDMISRRNATGTVIRMFPMTSLASNSGLQSQGQDLT